MQCIFDTAQHCKAIIVVIEKSGKIYLRLASNTSLAACASAHWVSIVIGQPVRHIRRCLLIKWNWEKREKKNAVTCRRRCWAWWPSLSGWLSDIAGEDSETESDANDRATVEMSLFRTTATIVSFFAIPICISWIHKTFYRKPFFAARSKRSGNFMSAKTTNLNLTSKSTSQLGGNNLNCAVRRIHSPNNAYSQYCWTPHICVCASGPR